VNIIPIQPARRAGSLAGYEVYACGNPSMTTAAHDTFVKAGLPEDDFFSDAFVQTDDAPASAPVLESS